MHDLIEKAGVSSAERGRRFRSRISELVVGVSDDERMTGYAARKAALRRQVAGAGDEALTLFAADKLSEVRELRREPPLDHDGTGARRRVRDVRARRLRHHQRSLALLGERLPESPLVRDFRDELRAILRERPSLASLRLSAVTRISERWRGARGNGKARERR